MAVIDRLHQWIRAQHSYYRRCRHRSHRLGLRCVRGFVYQNLCRKHLGTCLSYCPRWEGKSI